MTGNNSNGDSFGKQPGITLERVLLSILVAHQILGLGNVRLPTFCPEPAPSYLAPQPERQYQAPLRQ